MTSLHSVRALALCVSLCLAPFAATAQMFKDAALEALHASGKSVELQRLALQRVTAQADDVQAVLALEGMLKAARSAGAVKSALTQAQALEPTWYPARSALVEFYLMAPGMMGGSSAKAAELATAAPHPEQTRALQARVALQDNKVETALASLTSLLTVSDTELADDVRQWGAMAAFNLVNNGQAPKAAAYFERLSKERPGHAAGPYGLARVRTEAGAFDEAIKLFELSATLKGADILPVDYRKGIALQQAGRNDAARAAFKSFVATGKGQKSSLEDARKRVEQLGG